MNKFYQEFFRKIYCKTIVLYMTIDDVIIYKSLIEISKHTDLVKPIDVENIIVKFDSERQKYFYQLLVNKGLITPDFINDKRGHLISDYGKKRILEYRKKGINKFKKSIIGIIILIATIISAGVAIYSLFKNDLIKSESPHKERKMPPNIKKMPPKLQPMDAPKPNKKAMKKSSQTYSI